MTMAATASNGLESDDVMILYKAIRENKDERSLAAIEYVKKVIIDYTLETLALSFNAGKDCVVLMHLIRIALALLSMEEKQNPKNGTQKKDNYYQCSNLPIIYFQRDDEFPQLMQFCDQCATKYGFTVFKTLSDYRKGLETYLERGNKRCRGVMLGQRHSDPYCDTLGLQSHCTQGWPDIIRINPIIAWDYNHIWQFLRRYDIECCALYDHGFTSLGECHWTIPNPLLFNVQNRTFLPAHRLNCQNAERFGRILQPKCEAYLQKFTYFMFHYGKNQQIYKNGGNSNAKKQSLSSSSSSSIPSTHEMKLDEMDDPKLAVELKSVHVNVFLGGTPQYWNKKLQTRIKEGIICALLVHGGESSVNISVVEDTPTLHQLVAKSRNSDSLTLFTILDESCPAVS